MLDRDPLRDREAAGLAPARGANAADCTPTSRAFGCSALIASAIPDASPPPPIGMIDGLEVGNLLEQLEPDRSLAGDHLLVLECVEERHVLSLRVSSAAASASSNVSP